MHKHALGQRPLFGMTGRADQGVYEPGELLGGAGLGRSRVMSFRQDPLAASYCSTTLAGMRPRPLTAMPWPLAQARMSPLRCRLDDVRGRRCPRPALRACSTKGASCLRNARAFFLFRSISYCVRPTANRTVSSAGPPSRSSSSATVIFFAIPVSLIALGYLHVQDQLLYSGPATR